MVMIQGANNPGNRAQVDEFGRVEAHAVSITESTDSAIRGETFNLNTGNITLTSDADTPLFYVKNDGEDRDIIVSRVFFTFLGSTGGTGDVNASVISNPTGGTVTTGSELDIFNFNFGSGNTISIDSNMGGTGATVTGGLTPIRFLFTGDTQRHLISFDSIILPRGASMVVMLEPPTGNTSMVVQAGLNMHLSEPG